MDMTKADILLQHDRRIHVLERQMHYLLDRLESNYQQREQQREEVKHEVVKRCPVDSIKNETLGFNAVKNVVQHPKQTYTITTLKKMKPVNHNQHRKNRINEKRSPSINNDNKKPVEVKPKPMEVKPKCIVAIGGGLILESDDDDQNIHK
jgi:hypothetical protein